MSREMPKLPTIRPCLSLNGIFEVNAQVMLVGITAGLLHFLRRHHDEAKVTYSEKLQPGQTMIIRHYRKGEPLPPV